jgi:hypothetical protein
MHPGSRFDTLLRRRVAAARRMRFAATATDALAVFGAVVAVTLILHRVLGGEPDLTSVAWGFGSAMLLSLATGAVASRLGARERSRELVLLDQERRGEGSLIAAAALQTGGAKSRLGPLVLSRADLAADVAVPPGSRAIPVNSIVLALGCLCLSVGVALIQDPLRGPKAVSAGTPGGQLDVDRVPDATPERVSGGASAPDLAELARIELKADGVVYLPGEEIWLTLTLRPLAGTGEAVPLETVLGVADGSPSPDVGFGEGMRRVDLAFGWELPPRPLDPRVERYLLTPDVERLGMNKPGLITLQAYARPRVSGGVGGGVGSNPITIQIAENRTTEKVRQRAPVDLARSPKAPKGAPKDTPPQGHRGDRKPESGAPDRLERAQRKAQAVKPLLADGPRVEKEVEVFDRERGGRAPPPPTQASPTHVPTGREFSPREEATLERPDLSPKDRRILRAYFDALRRKG